VKKKNEIFAFRYYNMVETIFRAMRTISKFKPGFIYTSPTSKNLHELHSRNGHELIFKVRPKGERTGQWKMSAISSFKADADGAFESVLLSDGTRLRADKWTLKDNIIPIQEQVLEAASAQKKVSA
jgi:hypothetical protein